MRRTNEISETPQESAGMKLQALSRTCRLDGRERRANRSEQASCWGGEFGVGFPAEKIMIKFRLLLLALLVMVWTLQARAQFAHTEHKQIVDAAGRPLLVRATNLGNWLVPEGYMWVLKDGPQSPSEIRALALELLGPEGSTAFWQKWRENYVTREDITLLHRAGFNAIRVPLHYNLFESDDAEGFRLLDRLIGWSRVENLYVILDLHAAPGGQTGTNIDDSAGYPWLYQSPQEQDHLVAIWRRLAMHYRDEPAVLGYDLLNEPIPHFPKLAPLNPSLEPLYKKLSSEIRKVDGRHILFLGGAQWDTNFSVFGKPFDANVAYTFHKYWTAPDESVIRQYLDFRERYDVPIWMGESGENTDEWIAQFVKALEKNNIGWAFWPYKKMESPRSVVSIIPPADWRKIVEFAKLPRGTGHAEERLKARPEQETINRVFDELLESVRLQKCRVNEGYLRALGLKADVATASAGGAAK
jgi:endoglucanase